MSKKILVCGPPSSGKSTWVRERARVGDLVWDFDEIARVMFRVSSYPRPRFVVAVMQAMRDAMLQTLDGAGEASVYVIVTDPRDAAAIADWVRGFEVVTMQVDDVELLQRQAGRVEASAEDIVRELMEGL